MTDYAAARARHAAGYLATYRRERAAIGDAPRELAPWLDVVDAIYRRDFNPENPVRWRSLSAAASALRNHAWQHFGNADQADPYVRLRDAAETGYRMAVTIRIVADADAPICREHGPATLIDADAELWRCAGGADCRSPYLWLDGTERHRGRR
jgi:hypothetical protein